MLSAVVLFTGLPLEMLAAPQSMENKVADEDVLLLQNDSISVRMSGKNGGFYISNVEGDKTIKSDNNKDLLYHSDDYDTSFTSFRITRNGETKDYIFGGDYSFEGIKSGGVTVSQDAKDCQQNGAWVNWNSPSGSSWQIPDQTNTAWS